MLFYDFRSRAAATGQIDASGNFVSLQSFDPESFGFWTDIVADGSHLLFYDHQTRSAATGQLDALGHFVSQKTFGPDSLGFWTHIVSDGSQLLFYDNQSRSAATGRIDATGDFISLQEFGPGSLGFWTHIVSDGSHLLFYDARTRAAATVMIDDAGSFVSLKDFAPGSFGFWTHLVSSDGRLLFYDARTRAGVTGQIDPDGDFTVLQDIPPESFGFWTHIASDDSRLLFYDARTRAAATGEISGAGNFITLNIFPPGAFGIWTHIVDTIPGLNLTFATDISSANRDTLRARHTQAVRSITACGNLSDSEKQDLRRTYTRTIHHTTLNRPRVNASAVVGSSTLNVNFGVLFPQGDEEISQTLIHEMMHCAGFTHPDRRDPPAGQGCFAPNPAVFDCPNDGGQYYGTAPLRAEFCIAGAQSDVRLRLESKAALESCSIDASGTATIHTGS